jgi:hypothetical protein
MLVSDKQQIVQEIKRGIQIQLRMPEFPEDGTAVHTMKQVVIVVGLIQEPLSSRNTLGKCLWRLGFGATLIGMSLACPC